MECHLLKEKYCHGCDVLCERGEQGEGENGWCALLCVFFVLNHLVNGLRSIEEKKDKKKYRPFNIVSMTNQRMYLHLNLHLLFGFRINVLKNETRKKTFDFFFQSQKKCFHYYYVNLHHHYSCQNV